MSATDALINSIGTRVESKCILCVIEPVRRSSSIVVRAPPPLSIGETVVPRPGTAPHDHIYE